MGRACGRQARAVVPGGLGRSATVGGWLSPPPAAGTSRAAGCLPAHGPRVVGFGALRTVGGHRGGLSLLGPSSPPAFTSSPGDVFVWLEEATLTHEAGKHQEPAKAVLVETTLFRNVNRA